MEDKTDMISERKDIPILKNVLKRLNSNDLTHNVKGSFKKLAKSLSTPSHVSIKEEKKLSFTIKFFYSLGHIYNDLTVSIWFSYTLLIFKFQFSDSMAGALLLIGQMADAIASPYVGFQSDRMPDIKLFRVLGRRKFWHLLGVILNTLTVPLIYNEKPCFPGNCINASDWTRFAFYAVLIIIFQGGWAATQVSHVSLIVDLTDNANERIELNAYRQAATIFANICLYTVTLFVIGFDSNETLRQEDLNVFTKVSYIVCAIGIVFSILFQVFVKEPVTEPNERKPRGISTASAFSIETQRALHRGSVIGLMSFTSHNQNSSDDNDSIADIPVAIVIDVEKQLTKKSSEKKFWQWLISYNFWKVTIMYTMARMFFNLGQVYTPLYLQDTLQMPKNTVAIIPFATYIAGLICSFSAKPFSTKFGTRWVLIIGALFGITACIWIFIGSNSDAYKLWQIYCVSAFLGIGGTALIISTLALTSDLIGTNKTTGAFVFASMSFFDKAINGVVIELLSHFTPVSEIGQSLDYYKLVLALITGLSSVVALLGLLSIYKTTLGRKIHKSDKTNTNITLH
ncbi:major facilitator superfamily domain-containing protein 12-like [Oppia nitens]|uniref:major facilitator superfamily domain-containing protein 12-like n=1 Tax=Oppia nitens TaxID=1686743 RepID=UPI0023D9EA4E|nr:major facilitator superfamily domain-containing protein 12-like [Oppia nitens]